MEKEHKLGIIVPYRNRTTHLSIFKKSIKEYFDNIDIPYELIIVEQDDVKLFNRGKLLNIGFNYALKYNCDYVVFHDIDMIPVNVDYSYSDMPLHLSTDFISRDIYDRKVLFDEYFGGVTMFPVEIFKQINGYSNKYWGWGFEDDDLLLRCKKHNIKLDSIKIRNMGTSGQYLIFNGSNSYVKIKNEINLNNNSTIFISFCPEDVVCDHTKESDDFSIFTIPGYDFSISYNSFSRYSFCTFDNEKNVLYVNSNIKKDYLTNISIVINAYDKKITVYQDGVEIGVIENYKKLYPYLTEPYFYIGVGEPNREHNKNFFKGFFKSLAVFNECLEIDEIVEISNNFRKKLTTNFDNYKSADHLKLYYDSRYINFYGKITDLTGKHNDGEIFNCEKKILNIDEYKVIDIPYRRKSLFQSLSHDVNGFFDNKWKDQSTRWNQLRFINDVSKNYNILEKDGLLDLQYVKLKEHKVRNVTQIKVGIYET